MLQVPEIQQSEFKSPDISCQSKASDINMMTERGLDETERFPFDQTLNQTHPSQKSIQKQGGLQTNLNTCEITNQCPISIINDSRKRTLKHKRNKTQGETVDFRRDKVNTDDKSSSQKSDQNKEQLKLPSISEFDQSIRLKAPITAQVVHFQQNSLLAQYQKNAAATHKLIHDIEDMTPIQQSLNDQQSRSNRSIEPIPRLSKTEQEDQICQSISELNRIKSGRIFGQSTSQPPLGADLQPVITQKEKLSLKQSIAWKSPIRNTAIGNITLLSSHLKMNRMSNMHKKSYRDFRDYQCDLLQEKSV